MERNNTMNWNNTHSGSRALLFTLLLGDPFPKPRPLFLSKSRNRLD